MGSYYLLWAETGGGGGEKRGGVIQEVATRGHLNVGGVSFFFLQKLLNRVYLIWL